MLKNTINRKIISLIVICLSTYGLSLAQESNSYLASRAKQVKQEIAALMVQENGSVSLKLRERLIEQQNIFDTLSLYTKQNIARAEFIVGSLYYVMDDPLALQWFMRSAQFGNSDSQFNTGLSYQYGVMGREIDMERAMYWYTKAAESGQEFALLNMGEIYYNGRGVAFDFDRALYYFTWAADKGETQAMVNLGNIYNEGIYVKRDTEMAIAYWLDAAQRGVISCYALIGKMYSQGDGVRQNHKTALAYFRQGADDADCRYHIALYYYHGQGGVKKSYQMALELFTSIESKTESTECCYMLGECYRLGRGAKKDDKQAAAWYIKACNVMAYKRLLKMHRQGKIDIESMKN